MLKQTISAADIKFVRSLQQKKFRQESGMFVTEGKKMVEELLRSDFEIISIYSSHVADTPTPHTKIIRTKESDLVRMSSLSTSPGVLAVVKQKTWGPLNKLGGLSLVLDGISDPGNMGTIIRTAEWFGVEQILCSENCVELYNPKVVQATMGSLFRMRVVYGRLYQLLKPYLDTGTKMFAATLDGKSVSEIEKKFPLVLAIGSESSGLSDEVLQLATTKISIAGKGKAESLNAAVAAGVMMQQLIET